MAADGPQPPPPASTKRVTSGDAGRGFLAGSMAAVVAGACTHPIDTVKVRMQLAGGSNIGMVNMARTVIRTEGSMALYNGISGNVMRQTFLIGSRLGFYNVLKRFFEDERGRLSFAGKVGCGMAAGALGAAVGNPADLCMVRMQADGRLPLAQRRNYKHGIDALVRTSREEGVLRLWQGTQATINRAMIVTAAQMSVYDQAKEALATLTPLGDSALTHTLASLVAGGAAALASNPFDVAKTRLQNMKPEADGRYPYKGTFDCIMNTVRGEGARALFKGLSATFTRQAPLNVIRFVALEQLNKLFDQMGHARVILDTTMATRPVLCRCGKELRKCGECLRETKLNLLGLA